MLNSICDFIRDLMPFDADKIIQGRTNYNVTDFSEDIIVVDIFDLDLSSKSENYNSTTEIMTYSTGFKNTVTIDFFGDNSLSNATKFVNLQSSQKSLELQSSLKIGVFHSKGVKNIKEQVGTNYYERYQVEVIVYGVVSNDVSILRIDSVPVDTITDTSDSIDIIVNI